MRHVNQDNPFYRRGVFTLRRSTIERNFETISKVFNQAGLVVIRADNNMADDTITYYACGECFAFSDLGYCLPIYDLAFVEHEGQVSYAFIRKD